MELRLGLLQCLCKPTTLGKITLPKRACCRWKFQFIPDESGEPGIVGKDRCDAQGPETVCDVNPGIRLSDGDVFEVNSTRFNPATWSIQVHVDGRRVLGNVFCPAGLTQTSWAQPLSHRVRGRVRPAAPR